jgi:toxin-antitoxin system PIN domain toxin
VIVPDVDVLVYAYRREAERHDEYSGWLAGVVAGGAELGLVESSLTGFVRIVTNPRILADPAPTAEALGFVRALRTGRRTRSLTATDSTWTQFESFARTDRQVRGHLVPDAWLAAMTRSHGGGLATADRGFARFDGLDWFDPGAG